MVSADAGQPVPRGSAVHPSGALGGRVVRSTVSLASCELNETALPSLAGTSRRAVDRTDVEWSCRPLSRPHRRNTADAGGDPVSEEAAPRFIMCSRRRGGVALVSCAVAPCCSPPTRGWSDPDPALPPGHLVLPATRGWSDARRDLRIRIRVLPADAGVIRAARRSASPGPRAPCRRGGDPENAMGTDGGGCELWLQLRRLGCVSPAGSISKENGVSMWVVVPGRAIVFSMYRPSVSSLTIRRGAGSNSRRQ